ncbi:hypothetical protein [Candidatus Sororendozoicomonas aggregata]|uniref:hypothetical protein n=1 Tax=Candidatus Sororendozoicomonas aggregata TaxID=3073239 RepID=UPI002ED4168C
MTIIISNLLIKNDESKMFTILFTSGTRFIEKNTEKPITFFRRNVTKYHDGGRSVVNNFRLYQPKIDQRTDKPTSELEECGFARVSMFQLNSLSRVGTIRDLDIHSLYGEEEENKQATLCLLLYIACHEMYKNFVNLVYTGIPEYDFDDFMYTLNFRPITYHKAIQYAFFSLTGTRWERNLEEMCWYTKDKGETRWGEWVSPLALVHFNLENSVTEYFDCESSV